MDEAAPDGTGRCRSGPREDPSTGFTAKPTPAVTSAAPVALVAAGARSGEPSTGAAVRSPEIDVIRLGGKGVILVGTDGLLSLGGGTNTEQLNRLLAMIDDGADAQAVVADALARATGDNVTAVVWRMV